MENCFPFPGPAPEDPQEERLADALLEVADFLQARAARAEVGEAEDDATQERGMQHILSLVRQVRFLRNFQTNVREERETAC